MAVLKKPPAPPGRDPKLVVAGASALTLLFGLATGAMVGGQLTSADGAVELSVPGAMSISVACGGTTVIADGTSVRFLARDETCALEVALSPVMPLRGDLNVGAPGAYACIRDGTELRCGPAD